MDNFGRVHDVVRVKGQLQLLHDSNPFLPKLLQQETHLPTPYSMLTRTCTTDSHCSSVCVCVCVCVCVYVVQCCLVKHHPLSGLCLSFNYY